MLRKNLFLTICLGLLLLSSFGLAIEQTGILAGTVVDESGVGLPGVEVTISGPALMGSRTTITNTVGDFRIAQLNIGQKYSVVFSLKGFKSMDRKDVRIELGKESRLSVIMKFGEITEKVIVTGELPVVDQKSSTNQLNISKETVETLANDRQYQSIMEMMPGAIPGNNPSMMGADDSDNMYQFDGMESGDPMTKTWSTAMNFDNFEEMQVVAQGAPAEYGRGTGAVINVVTKSGSNQIHGTARFSFTKADWNAKPEKFNTTFSDATHYLNEARPSVNLGGPIIKDHIWFFGSYERRNKWKPATWYTSVQEALALSPTGSGRGYYKGHYASAKVTFRFGTFSVLGMWSEDPISIPEYYKYQNTVGQGGSDPMHQTQGGWNFNTEITTTLGANTYLIGRFSMKRGSLTLMSDIQEGIRYNRAGYTWGAGLYNYKSDRDHNQYALNINQFMDSSFGYHDIKFGVEYYDQKINSPVNSTYPGNDYITYRTNGVESMRYIFEDTPYINAMDYGKSITLFLQDKWEVSKGLTLNIGIRTEQTKLSNDDKVVINNFSFGKQISPRLGVVYAFGKNKISANWGRFYDIYGWNMVNNMQPDRFARTYDRYLGKYYTGVSGWEYYDTQYNTAPGSVTTADDNLKNSHMDEFGVTIERILNKKLAASISYMHRAWSDKIEDDDMDGDGAYHYYNETEWVNDDGTNNWGSTFKKYDAFIATFKKNLGDDKFQFLCSYTWSKLKGFALGDSETAWKDQPFTQHNACGYLPNDTRHQVRFYGSVIAPFDIVVGMNLYWMSGYPLTDFYNLLSTDPNQPGNYPYSKDPLGTTGRFPSDWRMDLRVEKKFKIAKLFTFSAYIDVFNVLNQQNENYDNAGNRGYNGNLGDYKMVNGNLVAVTPNPTYGKFTFFHAPMSFFIGAKIEW